MTKETLQESGYVYVMFDGYNQAHILENESGDWEKWVANKDHASYGIIYKNTHLEFCSTIPKKERVEWQDCMHRIQNFGEQHPRFHAPFMTYYRKKHS